MTIKILSQILINQIAAGEVVDRPASIVKELIENALDAGATEISVMLENGGRDFIKVSDNGSGIPANELQLAVTPHATSKIAEESDLSAVASLGFRGEALASIGSVSHLSLTSRTQEEESGMCIAIDGGRQQETIPKAAKVGTTVEVKRLFFNTPARRKFLKSDGAETTRVREVVQKIATAHPNVSFSLKSGNRTLLSLPRAEIKSRLLEIFGKELAGELIEIDYAIGDMKLWGIIGTPQVARPTSRHIRVHVNGRTIQDSSITHALKEAYRGLIEPKRWPTAAIFLEVCPSLVDVNVHPQKNEVRFRNRDSVWKLVNRGTTQALLGKNIVAPYRLNEPDPLSVDATFGTGRQSTFLQQNNLESKGAILMQQPTPLPTILGRDAVLQVHKCFLVTQDEEGILIIDQHALHERIIFEELHQRICKEDLESQKLLIPDAFGADAAQMESLELNQALFKKLGIEAEASGPASISVYALPTLLVSRNIDGASFIRDLLDKLGLNNYKSNEEEALVDILDMMSCKAAIKAGDELNQRELKDLLMKRKRIERESSCPHGRPTTMRLSIEELEKRFGRS